MDSQNDQLPNNQNSSSPDVEPKKIEISGDDGIISNVENNPSQTSTTSDSSFASSEINNSEVSNNSIPEQQPTEPEVNSEENVSDEQIKDSPDTTETTPNTNESTESATSSPESDTESTAKVNPMAIPPNQKKKSGAPKAAIFVAILIALGLAVVTIIAFMKAPKDESSNSTVPTSQTEQQAAEPAPVTPEEIDQITTSIDEDINKTTNDEDLPTSESVTDESLNL